MPDWRCQAACGYCPGGSPPARRRSRPMDLVEARARGFEAATRHPWEPARLAVIDQLIRRNVNLAAGSIVMDIGCGDTFVVESLAARYGTAQFFAVDSAFTGDLLAHYRARLNNPRIEMSSSLDGMT